MANTVDARKLREIYRSRYNHDCCLLTREIMDLWRLTAHNSNRGRHVKMHELMRRQEETLLAMRYYDAYPTERVPF